MLQNAIPTWQGADEKIWESTLEEASEGGLTGPPTREEMSRDLGPNWVAAKGFAVVQGAKVRAIDDFSDSVVNKAFGTSEKIDMLGLEHVVGWAHQRRGGQ